MIEYLGWSATAVFVGSYFFTRADAIKRVQMVGALMWVVYGFLISAYPVVVANVLVVGAAAWTLRHSEGFRFLAPSNGVSGAVERRRGGVSCGEKSSRWAWPLLYPRPRRRVR